jgi:RNA polymerase sigma-70 factor (ECF subfamily)
MDSVAVRRLDWAAVLFAGLTPAPELDAEPSSFESVYNAHYRDVFRHAIFTTRGRDDVEEIVAETFARAFAAWRTGHGPAGRALPWLLVICRRIATDRWRRRRLIAWLPLPDGMQPTTLRDRDDPGVPEPESTDRVAQVTEFWMWLDALSQALPSRQRDVIFLRYQRDLTDAEIGEVLGLSASGVRTLASRALTALRNHPELWA